MDLIEQFNFSIDLILGIFFQIFPFLQDWWTFFPFKLHLLRNEWSFCFVFLFFFDVQLSSPLQWVTIFFSLQIPSPLKFVDNFFIPFAICLPLQNGCIFFLPD